jgi:lysophospholipase L1-like esterase
MIVMVAPAFAAPLDDRACRSAKEAAFDADQPISPAQTMTIVAVGSSSTEGIHANAKDKLYPATMERALRRLWPQATVKVVNKGKGGETMRETLARFETDVVALKPSLVVWQLGVNDVLVHDGVQGRREEVQAGLRTLTDRGIPVILLDLQYAPAVLRDPDSLPMQAIIDDEAKKGARARVRHFRRFAVMKSLAEKHQVPDADMTVQDGLHMTDEMHACLGQLLAEMIAPVTVGQAFTPAGSAAAAPAP